MPPRHGPLRRSTRNNPDASLLEAQRHARRLSASRSRAQSHSRRYSNTTNATSVLTTSTRKARRKYHVRQSLMGPQVGELTIQRRADMLVDVAGDCLIKLIRTGLQGGRKRRGHTMEWRRAWDGFQTLRRSYIFPDNAPPFVLYGDILRDIDLQVQERLNPASLKRAVELCNLTHFVFTILRPDEAGDLLPIDDVRPSRKGKEKARNDDLLSTVHRRNLVLLEAWEKYWLVVVPREQRDKEEPLRIWLALATQIFVNFQCPSILDGDGPEELYPPAPDDVLRTLFHPSAVSRYGQWESTTGFESDDSGIEGMEQRIVEERWTKAARKREKELRETDLQTLSRRYPFGKFQIEILSYIETEILGTGIHLSTHDIHLATDSDASEVFSSEVEDIKPSRASSRRYVQPRYSSAHHHQHSHNHHMPTSDTFVPLPDIFHPAARSDTGESSESGYGPADAESGRASGDSAGNKTDEEEEGDVIQVEGPLHLDILADVAREMEDLARAQSATPRQVRPAEENQMPGHVEDPEWDIREGATPRLTLQPTSADNRKAFHFGKKQSDAIQVDWESQSQDQTPRPSGSRASPVLTRDVAQESQNTPKAAVSSSRVSPSSIQPPSIALIPLRTSMVSAPNVPSVSQDTPKAAELRPGAPTSSTQPPHRARLSDPPSPFVRNPASLSPRRPSIQHRSSRFATAPPQMAAQPQDVDNDEEEEEIEEVENPDFAVEDLLPDDQQLMGDKGESSEGPRTPVNEDLDIADLMPANSQLIDETPLEGSKLGPNGTHKDSAAIQSDQVIIFDDAAYVAGVVSDEAIIVAKLPTSQRLLATSRPRRSGDALEFAGQPDPVEDEEDRQLLRPAPSQPVVAPLQISGPPSLRDSTPIVVLKQSPPRTATSSRFGFRVGSVVDEDPYLVDFDGSPLEPDEDFVVPDDHVPRPSIIHGQIDGQVTAYSRISGKRKWTKHEELLLYRAVQKVPLSEHYPLRVVWYLYGEYGVISHELEQFNPQHMKDKMRVIVDSRSNKGRIINGRARYFLKKTHPLRAQYDQEMEAFRLEERERHDALRIQIQEEEQANAEEEEDEIEIEDEDAEGEDDEDDVAVELGDEDELDDDEFMDELESDNDKDIRRQLKAKREEAKRNADLESEEDDRVPGLTPPRQMARRTRISKKKREPKASSQQSSKGVVPRWETGPRASQRSQMVPLKSSHDDNHPEVGKGTRKRKSKNANEIQPVQHGRETSKRPKQVVEVEILSSRSRSQSAPRPASMRLKGAQAVSLYTTQPIVKKSRTRSSTSAKDKDQDTLPTKATRQGTETARRQALDDQMNRLEEERVDQLAQAFGHNDYDEEEEEINGHGDVDGEGKEEDGVNVAPAEVDGVEAEAEADREAAEKYEIAQLAVNQDLIRRKVLGEV